MDAVCAFFFLNLEQNFKIKGFENSTGLSFSKFGTTLVWTFVGVNVKLNMPRWASKRGSEETAAIVDVGEKLACDHRTKLPALGLGAELLSGGRAEKGIRLVRDLGLRHVYLDLNNQFSFGGAVPGVDAEDVRQGSAIALILQSQKL